MENNQVIDHPDYYRLPSGRQLEDFIDEYKLSFPLGSAVKYGWRAGKKFGESREKDLRKMRHYIDFLENRHPGEAITGSWESEVKYYLSIAQRY